MSQIAAPTERNAAQSRESSTAGQGGNAIADLLKSSKFGARVSGLVLAVDEVRTFNGNNADGSKYSSHSRRIQLFAGAGAGAVICGERQERLEDFKPLEPGELVDTPILGAKTEGKQMVFRIKL
jgi:hypothetical protein